MKHHEMETNNVRRTLLQVLYIAAGQCDPDFMDFGTRDWCPGGIVFFLALSDVTHGLKDGRLSQKVTVEGVVSE
jgi:hypothetical protein